MLDSTFQMRYFHFKFVSEDVMKASFPLQFCNGQLSVSAPNPEAPAACGNTLRVTVSWQGAEVLLQDLCSRYLELYPEVVCVPPGRWGWRGIGGRAGVARAAQGGRAGVAP